MMQWVKPKSVRQIGDVPGKNRVYIEDYVIRFARNLAKESQGKEQAAILLGNTYLYQEEKIYQISGIVKIPDFATRSEPAFSQETWDKLYTQIKENFTDLEIVGWFYAWKGFVSVSSQALLEIHKQNFQHRDKVLYVCAGEEREDSFYLYRGGRFEKQKGYYIYYEKNPEMLAYMEKESNRHVHIVEQEDDRVVRNIRGIMEEKEQLRKTSHHRESAQAHLGMGMATVMALILVVLGTAAMKNQKTLNEMKQQVEQLQKLQQWEQIASEVTSGITGSEQTTVETMSSGLSKMTATPAAAQASGEAVSGEAVESNVVAK